MKARDLIAKLKENLEFAQAYADPHPQYQIAREIIRLQIECRLTQQVLASRAASRYLWPAVAAGGGFAILNICTILNCGSMARAAGNDGGGRDGSAILRYLDQRALRVESLRATGRA